MITTLRVLRPSAGALVSASIASTTWRGAVEPRLHAENDSFIGEMTAVAFCADGRALGLPPDAALEKAHEVLFHVGLVKRATGSCGLLLRDEADGEAGACHRATDRNGVLDEPTNGLDRPPAPGCSRSSAK